jgi:hypothetical protein
MTARTLLDFETALAFKVWITAVRSNHEIRA